MACRFLTVDVFTNKIFEGAQIAVVPNAEQLSAELMQKIAAELNLWRTVFILPTTTSASFTVRIFNNS